MTEQVELFDIWATKICNDYRKMKRVCFGCGKVRCMSIDEAICEHCEKGSKNDL